MTDARLLLRTTALDLAIREKFVVFDLGVLRGYVDRDRCVLLLPTLADAQLSMTVPEGQKIPACRLFLSREHITRVEAKYRRSPISTRWSTPEFHHGRGGMHP